MLGGGGGEGAPDDFAILYEEGLALCEAHHGGDAEGFGDGSVVIGDEGEWEFVFLLEFFLCVLLVFADAENLYAAAGEAGEGIAKGAGFLGAAGGIRLRVEVDEGDAFFVGVGEVNGGAVLIDGGDGGGRGADIDGAGRGEAEEGEEAHG